MRLWKRLLLGVLALLLVLVAGAALFVSQVDPNAYRGTISRLVQDATGRELRIGGDLRIKLLPLPSLEANDVSFANAPWASPAEMLRARRLRADVSLLPLLKGLIVIRRLDVIDTRVFLQTDADGKGNWVFGDESAPAAETEHAAPSEGWRVAVWKVRIENAALEYLDGTSGSRKNLQVAELTLASRLPGEPTAVDLRATYQGLPVELEGTLGASGAVAPNEPLDMDLRGRFGDAQLGIKGRVGAPLQAGDIRLAVELASPSTKAITDAAGVDVEELGPVAVKLQVVEEGGRLQLDPIEAHARLRGNDVSISGSLRNIVLAGLAGADGGKTPGDAMKVALQGALGQANFSIAGEVGPPPGTGGVRLEIAADAASTRPLSELAGVDLEELGPLALSLTLLGQGGRFDLDDIVLHARAREADARVRGSLTGIELERGAADAQSKPAKVHLEGALGEAAFTLTGEAARPLQGKDMRLNFALDAKSTRALGALAGVHVEELGPLDLQLTIIEQGERFDVDAIQLTARPRNAHVSIKGSIRDVLGKPRPQLEVAATANTLRQLDERLPDAGPVKVAAAVRPSGELIEIRRLAAKVGKSDLSGSATIDTGGERPRTEAKLHADLIDLTELLPAARQAENGAIPEKAGDGRIFPAEPLPLDGLKMLNADIVLAIDRLLTSGLTLDKVNVAARLENGNLTVKPAAQVAGGAIGGTIGVDARVQPAKFSADVNASKVSIGTLSEELRGFETSEGLDTDLQVKLSAEGDSVRALMAGLDGDIRLQIGAGRLNNTVLNRVGADLLTQLISVAVPAGEEEKTTTFKCGVVRFEVRKGDAVADQTLVMETDKVLLVGGGVIDLKTEQLDLGARLAARKGIRIGAGTLSSLMRLRGTLADPRLGTDLKGMAQTGAKVGIAVATGGLSLLAESVYGRINEDELPCQTALNRKIEATPSQLKALFE